MNRKTMIDPDDAAWFNPQKEAVREGEGAPPASRPEDSEPDDHETARPKLFYGPV